MDVIERFKANTKKGITNGCISLLEGIPQKEMLKPCQDMLRKATTSLLNDDVDITRTFSYGPEQGDQEFREELAKFLSHQYNDNVNGDNLLLTAGATHGVHLLCSILFGWGTTCFIEDPTYFAMHRVLKNDLHLNVVPVKTDSEGVDIEDLDKLLTEHKPSVLPSDKLYWSFLYTVPVYNNPRGLSYSSERCQALLKLARKHQILIIADDVYNLLCYDTCKPPQRLFAYDKKSEPDYYGNVVSNGTFSKILMPGIRVGWIEGPQILIDKLSTSSLSFSGGSFNHFAGLIINEILKLNLLTPHLEFLKENYSSRMNMLCEALAKIPGIKFTKSGGGYFLWVELPGNIDAIEFMSLTVDNGAVMFIPGQCTSPTGRYRNYVRLAICKEPEDRIKQGIQLFAQYFEKLMERSKSEAKS